MATVEIVDRSEMTDSLREMLTLEPGKTAIVTVCLLYTSDAADE